MAYTKRELEAGELLACRICLATTTKLFGIHEYRLDKVFVDTLGISLSAWDGLPQHLCSFCRSLLLKSADLRQRCRRAENLLKQSLMHTRVITTNFIETIDRITNKLSLRLTITHVDREPKPDDTHDILDDDQFDSNDKLYIDDKLDTVDKLDKDDQPGAESDESQFLSELCEPEIYVNDVKFTNVIATEIDIKHEPRTLRKRGSKRAKSKKVKNEEEKVTPKKKKGFKWYFSSEEDYVKFESKYNIKVVKLDEEEQKREMECRRETENYRHAHVRCEKCCKGFLSLITFENHNKIHDPSTGPNECSLCYSRYKFPTHLRQHMMESHSHKYTCKICNQVIRRRSAAMMHSAFHAGRTFECKYCGRTFKKSSTRYTHMRIHHPGENAAGGSCGVCGETFTGALGLQQHHTRKHNKIQAPYKVAHGPLHYATKIPTVASGPTIPPTVPELKCSTCNVQFDSLDAVARHTDRTRNSVCDPAFKACPQCGETFSEEEQLKSHRLVHTKKTYRCDDCNQSFANKSSLSTHIDRVHLKIKPRYKIIYKYSAARRGLDEYMCETCGKGYTSFANLKTHQLRHTGERPFKCNMCPKSFLTAAQVKGHKERVHTGVKKYQCSQCPKTFLDKSSIYKHKVVHTGEKPFECQICNKSFTQSGSLTTHIKYVHMKVKPPPRRRRRDAV